MAQFDLSSVPRDLQGDAFFASVQFAAGGGYDLSAYRVTTAWNSAAVSWNKATAAASWTTPGGDYDATTPAYNGPGMHGTQGSFDVTQLVRDWLSGATPNDGVLLRETNENQNVALTDTPYLEIMSWPQAGNQGTQDMQTRNITDRLTAAVDPVNGNVSVEGTAFAEAGVGQNLSLGFNLQENGFYGVPTFNFTARGTQLFPDLYNHGSFVYETPTGENYAFIQTASGWTSPAGVDATATANTVGSNPIPAISGGPGIALRFNDTGITNEYTTAGDYYGLLLSSSDPSGNTITYNYNSSQQITSVTDTQGRTFNITYNTDGTVSKVTDAASSRFVTFTYTAIPGLSGTTELTKFTDATSKSVSFGYDSNGTLNKITDADGNTTTMAPDYGATGEEDHITSITYGASGTSPSTFGYALAASTSAPAGSTTITDPNSGHTTVTYDATDRVTQVTDPLGHSTSTGWSPDNKPSMTENGLSAITSYSYDALNNLTSITSPNGTGSSRSTSFTYPTPTGSLSDYEANTSKDAQGNTTSYGYNSKFELNTTSTPGSVGGTPTQHHQGDSGISCTNAKTGELCSQVDGNGNTTTYAYDTSGNVTTITPQAPQGATVMTYDADGRMITKQDGRGTKLYYTYDKDDRITQVSSSATTCTTTNCSAYTYNGEGSLTKRIDPSGTTSYSYDAQLRPLTKNTPTGNTSMTYDGNGNMLTYVDAGGTTTYKYDAANRNISLAEPGGSCPASPSFPNSTKCTTFSYDNANNKTGINYPNGQTVTIGFDSSARETSVTAKTHTGTTIVSRTYDYEAGTTDTDLRQNVTDQAGTTTAYTYDPMNRLLSAAPAGGATQSWTYDDNGNRLSAAGSGVITYSKYNADDELCYSASTNTAACGSAPSGATTYTYNGSGDLTATSGSVISAATYSAFDQTASTTKSGTTTADAYSDVTSDERTTAGSTSYVNGILGVTRQTTGSASVEYIRDPEGNLIANESGGSSSYYTADALGSVILITDHTGATAATYSYDAWGNVTGSSGAQASSNPYRYAGGLTDGNSLVKFGTRYYDSTTGRFTQQDPTGQESNAYAYVGCNPVNAGDPTGRDGAECLSDLGDAFVDADLVGDAAGLIGISTVAEPVTAGVSTASGLAGVALFTFAAAQGTYSVTKAFEDC